MITAEADPPESLCVHQHHPQAALPGQMAPSPWGAALAELKEQTVCNEADTGSSCNPPAVYLGLGFRSSYHISVT